MVFDQTIFVARRAITVIVLCCNTIAPSLIADSEEQDPEMVKLAHSIVSAAEMNFNRIQTWSGSVTVRRVEIKKKFDLKTESTASIDFHDDRPTVQVERQHRR